MEDLTRRPTVVDLFCGAGGLSEGFRQAGFHVLAGQDLNEVAGETYKSTHAGSAFIPGRIQNIGGRDILKAIDGRVAEIDVIVGGPPCQGYSVYNHKRGEHDPRAGLFRHYLKIVAELQPKWIVMENVAGITSIANGGIVREIQSGMRSLGYRVEWRLLKAEEFGVPQERRRVFFIGTRTDLPIRFPTPTHGPGKLDFVSVWDAISDLPDLANGQRTNSIPYRCGPQNDFQEYVRGGEELATCHSAPALAQVNIERMQHIPPGGSWRDIPFELLPNGMKRAKRSDHTKRYGRPRASDLASTILTKCDVHWGAYIHPLQDRAISVREAARFQSIPDSYQFSGGLTDQYVQVGNAVPPLLAKAVAHAVADAMSINPITSFSEPVKENLSLAI